MPRSLALFSCSNPRLPFDLSPFPLKFFHHPCRHLQANAKDNEAILNFVLVSAFLGLFAAQVADAYKEDK